MTLLLGQEAVAFSDCWSRQTCRTRVGRAALCERDGRGELDTPVLRDVLDAVPACVARMFVAFNQQLMVARDWP